MIVHSLYGECGSCGRKDLIVVQDADKNGHPIGGKVLAIHYDRPDIVKGEVCKGTIPKGAAK